MSLLVWLPLNGDLHNQGLNPLTVSNHNATVNSTLGKLGKCYYFNGSSQWLEFDDTLGGIYNGDFSWAIWVYPTDSTRSILFSEYQSTGSSNVALEIDTSRKLRIWWNGSPDWHPNYALPLNTWSHVVVTKTTGKLSAYINGTFVESWTGTLSQRTSTSHIRIGDDYRGGSTVSFQGYLQDARIYNHALTPKEIKELSKCLVLHYKLTGGPGYNLISPSEMRISENGQTSTNEYMSICETKDIFDVCGLVPYTVSFDIKAAVAHSFNIYGNPGTNPKYMFTSTSINVTTEWQRFSYTFTPYLAHADGTWSSIAVYGIYGSGAIVSVRNVKLEVGSTATAVNPNDTTVWDCSGYKNNGIQTGGLPLATDTQRYQYSKVFANGKYIRVLNRPKEFLPKDAVTVALWVKYSTWGNPISCAQSGGWNFENGTTAPAGLQFPVYLGSSVGYKVAKSGIPAADLLNQWHHLVGTFDKTNVKIYIDGELKATTATGSTNDITYANNYLFIAAEAAANTTSPETSAFTGNISDVRIYATALSADDIKELYDTGAAIDNKGNIHCYELIEKTNESPSITKTGLVTVDEFTEDNTDVSGGVAGQAAFYEDTILGNQLLED